MNMIIMWPRSSSSDRNNNKVHTLYLLRKILCTFSICFLPTLPLVAHPSRKRNKSATWTQTRIEKKNPHCYRNPHSKLQISIVSSIPSLNTLKYLLSVYIQTYPKKSSSKNDFLSLSELSSHEPHKRDTLPHAIDFFLSFFCNWEKLVCFRCLTCSFIPYAKPDLWLSFP